MPECLLGDLSFNFNNLRGKISDSLFRRSLLSYLFFGDNIARSLEIKLWVYCKLIDKHGAIPENTQEVEGQSGDRVTAASSVNPKRKRPDKEKSDVWDHFTKVKKEGAGLFDKAQCNYCLRPFNVHLVKQQAH